MQKHKPDSVPLAIASLFVRFLDCAIIAMGIFQLVLGALSAYWPSVPGHVVSAELTLATQPYHLAEPTYTPELTYRYVVNGSSYVGSRVAFGSLPSTFSMLVWNAGQEIPVYYFPARPQISVLETGVQWSYFIFMSALGVLCLFLPELMSWLLRAIISLKR